MTPIAAPAPFARIGSTVIEAAAQLRQVGRQRPALIVLLVTYLVAACCASGPIAVGIGCVAVAVTAIRVTCIVRAERRRQLIS